MIAAVLFPANPSADFNEQKDTHIAISINSVYKPLQRVFKVVLAILALEKWSQISSSIFAYC